jgi:hypothetical protein
MWKLKHQCYKLSLNTDQASSLSRAVEQTKHTHNQANPQGTNFY